jgi:fibronectin-binding autotransporter adhesin
MTNWTRGILAGLVILAGSLVGREVHAQTAFSGSYTFGANGNVNSFAYNGTPILNLTVGNLTKNGVTTASSSGNFRASNWAIDPSASGTTGSLTGSIDTSMYFEFTLTANTGYTFNLDTIGFAVGRSATGPRQWQWRSSIDSYASPISTYSTLNANVTNTSGVLTTPDANSSYAGNVLALSGSSAAFQSLSGITLRIYGYNSEAAAGTGGLQTSLSFAGSLLGSGGSSATWSGSGSGGTWENGQNGGFGTAYSNSPTTTVTFGGTGETVNVIGTVEAATITFDSAGYTLTDGGITLANSNIAVNAGVAAVGSAISGSNGLLKSGPGTLVLSGSNAYSGLTNISAGRLQIAADSALGATVNGLSISGTLSTTANVSLGVDRNVSGGGTLDVAPGTTLTSSGSFAMSAVTLANSGALDLQGATRSVGTLTFGTAATVNGSGAISVTGLSATNVTSGSAIVNPAITFTSGDKTVDVGSGGTLALNGDIAGTTGRILKTGAGTLIASGSNSTSGYRLGAAGASPTNGGTLILAAAAASGTATQLQLNYGTVQATAPFTFANGLSIGGRSGAVAVLGGANAMTFSGSTSFFRATATSGELRLDVNNATSLNGVVGPTSGSGTATGITIGGTGSLTINGNASALTDLVTIQDLLDLTVNGTLFSGAAGSLVAQAGTLLGGSGTINGAVTMANGSILAPGTSPGTLTIASALNLNDATNLLFELSATDQTVGGGVNDLITGITNLTLDGVLNVVAIGDFSTVSAGAKWRLFNYSGTLTDQLLTLGSMPTLAGGNSFAIDIATPGEVSLVVVPEPTAVALGCTGAVLAGLAAWKRRRRA